MYFKVKRESKVFACQNPLDQGGGRKGLPKSFINRFTQVYMDKLSAEDMLHICSHLYPDFETSMLQKMISFTNKVVIDPNLMFNCFRSLCFYVFRWMMWLSLNQETIHGSSTYVIYCAGAL